MAFLRADDDLLFYVAWSQGPSGGPRFVLGEPIEGTDDDNAITGEDEPVPNPIFLLAGRARSIPWYYNGTISLTGKALVFTAKDMSTQTIITQKANAVGGGSEDDFTTPPLGGDGLPTLDDDGKRMPGFINLDGQDTALARCAEHEYDVKIYDPADPTDPDFPTADKFTLRDHANR